MTDGPFSYPSQGRFTIAAKHHISIAEIYETELVDIEKVSDSQALPGRWQGGLHQPVLWDQDSSLYPVPQGKSFSVLSTEKGARGTGRNWMKGSLAMS